MKRGKLTPLSPGPRLRSTFNLASFFFRGLFFFFCPRECALSFILTCIPQRFIIFHYAHGDGHGLESNSPPPPDETGRPVVLYMFLRPGPNGCRDIQRFGILWQKVRSYPGSAHHRDSHRRTSFPPSLPPLTCSLFRLFAPPERKRPSFFAASSTKEALACVSSTPAPLGKILAHSVHIRLYVSYQYSF